MKKSAKHSRLPLLKAILCTAALVFTGGVSAACLDDKQLRGVNMAGAEFGSHTLPGTMNTHYTYPQPGEMEYFAEKGANTIRLPIRWERVQRQLFGELDGKEVAEIERVVNRAQSLGQCVIIDVHNYGSYHSELIGSDAVPTAAFIDVWQKLAAMFNDEKHVAFGLMNEPYKLSIAAWGGIAQETLTALREFGAENLILVSGGRWSGVHEWQKTIGGASNAEVFADLKDPLKRSALEVHQYANAGYTGEVEACYEPDHFDAMFKSLAEWARANSQQIFLGEFGTPPDASCLSTLQRMVSLLDDPTVWRGWTYWAAGGWWGDYELAVSPRDGQDAPQMAVLEPYLRAETRSTEEPKACRSMIPKIVSVGTDR